MTNDPDHEVREQLRNARRRIAALQWQLHAEQHEHAMAERDREMADLEDE